MPTGFLPAPFSGWACLSPHEISFHRISKACRTWFEVRVTEAGHLGRRGGVDLMVAMNPQTWDRDINEIEPGGYLFCDRPDPCRPRVPK